MKESKKYMTVTDIINELIELNPKYDKLRGYLYTRHSKQELEDMLLEERERHNVRKQ